MPEIAESARRWSGYVCPDCRFVFRVPRDHDGVGLVCPSCRRMLRLPQAGDAVPPLMVAMRRMEEAVEVPAEEQEVADATEEVVEQEAVPDEAGDPGKRRKRKKRRSRTAEGGMSWEQQQSRRAGEGRRERWRMRWMLGGGIAMFLGISWLVVAILGGSGAPPGPVRPAPVVDASAPESVDEAGAATLVRSDADLLTEAEPLVRRLLEAESVDELLALVYLPERAGPRIRAYYRDGRVEAPGLGRFQSEIFHGDGFVWLVAQTRDFESREIAFIDGPDGLKVDWESFVGWSEMSWPDFIRERPEEGKRFRVILSDVEYYNFEFSDDKRWRSYALKSPDGEHVLYGYVERGSLVDEQIRSGEKEKQWTCVLELAYPPGGGAASQVLIERFLTEGWIEVPGKE